MIISAILSMLLAGCTAPRSTADVWQEKQGIERDSIVRDNMRSIQLAAETFASDHGGDAYPTVIDDSFKTYFRGGTPGERPAPVGMVNPFTALNEFPAIGPQMDPFAVRSGARFPLPPGKIFYCPLANGKGYAIVGGAHDGMVLADINNPGQVLVFTNITH